MVTKQIIRGPLSLKPLYPLLFVSDEGPNKIPKESVTPTLVGEKAFGLSCLPKSWTLPFVVVSDNLLRLYIDQEPNRERVLKRWAAHIITAAALVEIEGEMPIIVRSSGVSEGLEERGKFYSSDGLLNNVVQPLTRCLKKLASDRDLNQQRIPLIIQKYVVPISAKGHLSNERRWYEEKRDWLGQFEEIITKSTQPFPINLRNWRKKIPVSDWTDKPLDCNLSAHVSEVLKLPAAWAYEQRLRLHFEWVWDGTTIHLVQADQERMLDGVDPTVGHESRSISSKFLPKCLKKINEFHAGKYSKIQNVFTYLKLGLPVIDLYVLDDQAVINDLASGKILSDLEEDLSELVKGSLVIRIDIATNDEKSRQLLPRTNEVREIGSALLWLKEMSAKIKGSVPHDMAFIFHNFVPSVSSAFAYAAPGERKVQIEALWGLPEGLYYNSHDKYVVDTQIPRAKELRNEDIDRFNIREKRSFKRFFVSPDEDGNWTTKTLKPPYDWRGSIQRQEWVKQIALESRRIAEEERESLSIMWFVGVLKGVCSRPILPWYHEFYDPRIANRAQTHRTKTPFDKSLVIKTSADIEELQKEASASRSSVRRVRIQPREEKLLRDKNTLCMIGELARKIDAIILLEGGVLSHAYYQLMQTNAIVEVRHPFEDFNDKREFNKLVRDKVPFNIERGGEVVSKTHLSGEFLLRALREKLVEEACEVLDAVDQDSIIGELADVSEIIDGILSQLGLKRDRLRKLQDQKRKRAGGFKDGLVLLRTRNPLPTKKRRDSCDTLFDQLTQPDRGVNITIDDREIIELGHAVDKWSDRREHQAAEELILKIVVPIVRDNWTATAPETVIGSDPSNVITGRIKGKRSGAKLQIELSIFIPGQKQLRLF